MEGDAATTNKVSTAQTFRKECDSIGTDEVGAFPAVLGQPLMRGLEPLFSAEIVFDASASAQISDLSQFGEVRYLMAFISGTPLYKTVTASDNSPNVKFWHGPARGRLANCRHFVGQIRQESIRFRI